MNLYDFVFKIGGYMCHQKPERSFFFQGYQFPICARCTGIMIGLIFGLIIGFLTFFNKFYLLVIFCLPMAFDGLIQKFTSYLSNNRRRFITGLLFGFSYIYIFVMLDKIFG